MNLKRRDAVAIVAVVVVLITGSHIPPNQAFAISTIGKIINSIVVGPCVQENGKFMYLICAKLDPSLLNNGAVVKSLLLSDKTVLKNLLLNNATALKSMLLNNATVSK